MALILGPLFIPQKRIAFTLYAILGAFTLREISVLLKRTKTTISLPISFLIYGVLVILAYSFIFSGVDLRALMIAFASIIILISVLELYQTGEQPFERISTSIWTPVFVASSFLGISYFLAYRNDLPSIEITIALFALIWVNDSAAYLIGRKVGKTKLFERLSPNKTWEGSLSGLLFSLLAAYGLSYLDGMPSAPIMLGFGFTCVVFGSFGDLLESRLKRAADVKDSGMFLPGHGGFFDRFDAMMLAVPASILYFEIVTQK